jgi:hypothetical protein
MPPLFYVTEKSAIKRLKAPHSIEYLKQNLNDIKIKNHTVKQQQGLCFNENCVLVPILLAAYTAVTW